MKIIISHNIIMPKRNSVSRRLARVERELEQDKPEVKTLDVLINPLSPSQQIITQQGIFNGTTFSNYDLTRGFTQGLLNDQGNLDGNYCKLTSLDMRIYLDNTQNDLVTTPLQSQNAQVRLMIVRVPAAEILTPADIQTQVLAYGDPTTYGALCNVSPLKRNSTINGGYDVMYDRVHSLTTPESSATSTGSSVKSTKYVHFRKKWKKGLTLRFSGSAAALTLEQNRLYLFAMDSTNLIGGASLNGCRLSFVSRIRYSDQ